MDELMPKELSNSHQNMIKRIFIGDQKRSFKTSKNYVFDSSHTFMFLIDSHGTMIYNLSKYLIMILEFQLIKDKDYIFMLDHNFDFIANTKNFTNDYLLNQKIFFKYKLSIFEMLKMKPENITQKFIEVFNTLEKQKEFRQIKTDEYFIPQLYVPLGEKNKGIVQVNNYNIKKNKLLAKIGNLDNNNFINNKINKGSILEDNEQEQLINEKNKEEILEALLNNGERVIKKNFSFNLNKMKFVENISKELSKILDNQLTNDNNEEQNLIIGSKKLINDLLTRKDLLNNSLLIDITMIYIYDRPFYFIKIKDEKKITLKMNNFISNANKKINSIISPASGYFRQGSNQFFDKRQNTSISKKETEFDDINSINSSLYNDSRKKVITNFNSNKPYEIVIESYGQNKKEILDKIVKYRTIINQGKFIFFIKSFLFLFIILIIFIYIFNMIIQRISINMLEKILLTFYHNAQTKNMILNIFSKLLGHFHDLAHLTTQVTSSTYKASILSYAEDLRNYFHFFKKNYIEYNLEMGKTFLTIFHKKNFLKLRGKWKEVLYNSEYCSEVDFIIHFIFSIEFDSIADIEKDIDIFLFYRNNTNREEKIITSFIKLVFYFSVNYEENYKTIYDEIDREIYSSYHYHSKKSNLINYALEISSLLLYLFFFICCFIFLYYSNKIIIKNIIFLFLDFSMEDQENYKNSSSNYISDIMGKLLQFQKLLNDFNLTKVKIYSDYLDKKTINNVLDGSENKIEIKNMEIQKDEDSNKINDFKSKKSNNSSQNILIKTNYKLNIENIKGKKGELKANNNSNSTSKVLNFKKILNSPSINRSNNIRLKKTLKIDQMRKNNGINYNPSFKTESYLKDNFIEALLDKSNKIIIYIIKVHTTIILFFLVVIVGYSTYKIKNNSIYIEQYERFYFDFHIIEERYSLLYYYWNTMKTLIIFDYKDERWYKMKQIMEKMNSHYDTISNNYNTLLSKNRNFYNEVNKLFEIFTYNKKDCVDYLKNNFCINISNCRNYIITNDSIFNSGIDFGYKTCFSYINNIFMDYQSIKNKTNAQEIINTITDNKFYEFKRMKQSTANVFYFLKEKIYKVFETEATLFGQRYKRDVLVLNFISLIISILILLFVNIFIFITVYNFSEPIKDSAYRINCSFYYIKNYRLKK